MGKANQEPSTSTIEIIHGDCLDVLDEFENDYFDLSCFSPPYGIGSDVFDIRHDFKPGGRFIPYMLEICRVSRLAAVNFTQRVYDGIYQPYTEELIMALQEYGVTLFDRWTVVKPRHMPTRGNRALTRYEWVLLFTRHNHKHIVRLGEGSTIIEVTMHNRAVNGNVGLRPYFPEIPRQAISMYAEYNVLDPFCGTGTTLKEAKKLGVRGIGVELDDTVFASLKMDLQV